MSVLGKAVSPRPQVLTAPSAILLPLVGDVLINIAGLNERFHMRPVEVTRCRVFAETLQRCLEERVLKVDFLDNEPARVPVPRTWNSRQSLVPSKALFGYLDLH